MLPMKGARGAADTYTGIKLMPLYLKVLPTVAEFQNLLKLALKFSSFLYDIRNISPEINITSLCSFPPGVSQTCWDLSFYGKHLTIF